MSGALEALREQPVRAYIGLGSNLTEPRAQVEGAIAELGTLPASLLCAVSGLYRTAPVGVTEQPDFVNAVVGVATRLRPQALLAALQQLERRHGRIRAGRRWGPRTLDLDLLLYGGECIGEPNLVVPHPHMHGRAFVLVPLADVVPGQMLIPGQGRLSALLGALAPGPGIDRLRPSGGRVVTRASDRALC
jgi:2-amino-4-hydroxy-6-hydroxymethyldihydropteridine diphosphokinase